MSFQEGFGISQFDTALNLSYSTILSDCRQFFKREIFKRLLHLLAAKIKATKEAVYVTSKNNKSNTQNTSILRVQKDKNNPYVMMNKTFLEDPRLSFKAKGILAYVLSKPDNWQVRVSDLVKRSDDGETAVYSGLNELKQYGYLRKYPVRIDGKIHHWESVVYEIPTTPENLLLENPEEVEKSQLCKNDIPENLFLENQDVENLNQENLNQENRERNNNDFKELMNKENNKSVSQSVQPEEPEKKETDGQTNEVHTLFEQSQVELFENEELKEHIKEAITQAYTQPATRNIIQRIRLEHIDRALAKFREAQEQQNIKNPKLYFFKCLISAITEHGLSATAWTS